MLKPSDVREDTPLKDMVEVLRSGPPGPWPADWTKWDVTQKAHIELLHETMRDTPAYPEGRWSGRGIVISVNAKPGHSSGKDLPHGYFPGAWIVVKELRRLGCELPILFTHMGKLEWDSELTKLVEPLGVKVLDLEKPDDYWKPMRILAGWESKIDAVCRCPFEEVLYLDADSIPLRNPDEIFDSPHLKHYGAILFPDVPPHDRNEWLPKEVWYNMGMEPNPDVVDAETGQFFIHKRTWWRELNVCRFLNEHSDFVYKWVFGDKSTFIIASHKIYQHDLLLEGLAAPP